jgi:hypothetical protein
VAALAGIRLPIEQDTTRHLAMLRILYGACAAALNAFRAAGNPVDEQLVIDLEMMVTRTRAETERLEASGTPTADCGEETVTGGSTAAR